MITDFLPNFGNLAFTIAAFVIALSIIVFIHEFGHYIVARWCGIRSDVFSIGFGPVIWSRQDKRKTRWQIAALPLGGYVRFAGDTDPSSLQTAAQTGQALPRDTLQGAPLWARMATVAAGPVFNFIFSALVFTVLIFATGTPRVPLTIDTIAAHPGVGAYDLQSGDALLAVADQEIGEAGQGLDMRALPRAALLDYRVLRDGAELAVSGPHPFPARVGGLVPDAAADEAGLRPGDVIVRANGDAVITFYDLLATVEASDGAPIPLEVWRDGAFFPITLTPRRLDEPQADGSFASNWRIGIISSGLFTWQNEAISPVRAISAGVSQVGFVIKMSLSGLYNMVIGNISTCNLSGPIGIADTAGTVAAQGWVSFVQFIALLSTAIGLFNLFPVPVLDGGHLVLYAYEAIMGRPPSEKIMRALMSIGLTLLLALMLFAVMNDILC